MWEGKRYVAGAAVEVGLPFRLAAEIDALYRRTGTSHSECFFTFCSYSSVRGNLFEFPALLKYRFRLGAAAPFVSGGVAYQWVRRASGAVLSWRTGPMVPDEVVDYTVRRFPFTNRAENHVGGVAGGGLEFRAGRVRLAPEIRYTRWSGRYWEFYGSRGFFTGSNLNELGVLFGVWF